jgi:flagellar protein FliO/FliZ
MMSTRAPTCPPATLYATNAQELAPASLLARMRRGSAGALLASIFLMPLAACAVQPAATNATASQAAPAPSRVAAQPAAQAPATRQQEGSTAAASQDGGTAAPAPSASAPQATTGSTSARPATSATGTTPDTPVAERATTVGEVPTVAATTPTPTPGAATMPSAPAAIPNTPANPATIPQAPGPSAGTLLQTILALVLVLALLAGLAWAAKRYGPRMAGGSANLRMVGALNIGGRERIMVVEVGDQWIVVGASPGRVNALATMPKGDALASASLAGHAPSASSFSDWLKQTIDKRNAK